jgi:hypothetical protein
MYPLHQSLDASVPTQEPATRGTPRIRWFQFRLRSLLLVMLVVAVFLAGRSSVHYRDAFAPSLEGQWQIEFPAGHRRTVSIVKLGQGHYSLGAGGNLSGTYEWRNGQLVVIDPADERFAGLVWKWDGERLVLIGEPGNRPAGASYTGTVLSRPAAADSDGRNATAQR